MNQINTFDFQKPSWLKKCVHQPLLYQRQRVVTSNSLWGICTKCQPNHRPKKITNSLVRFSSHLGYYHKKENGSPSLPLTFNITHIHSSLISSVSSCFKCHIIPFAKYYTRDSHSKTQQSDTEHVYLFYGTALLSSTQNVYGALSRCNTLVHTVLEN